MAALESTWPWMSPACDDRPERVGPRVTVAPSVRPGGGPPPAGPHRRPEEVRRTRGGAEATCLGSLGKDGRAGRRPSPTHKASRQCPPGATAHRPERESRPAGWESSRYGRHKFPTGDVKPGGMWPTGPPGPIAGAAGWRRPRPMSSVAHRGGLNCRSPVEFPARSTVSGLEPVTAERQRDPTRIVPKSSAAGTRCRHPA